MIGLAFAIGLLLGYGLGRYFWTKRIQKVGCIEIKVNEPFTRESIEALTDAIRATELKRLARR